MTHDELLGEIDQWLTHSEIAKRQPNKAINVLKALRAVVELHKMQEITLPDGSYGQNCIECDNSWGFCATLHAIIDELK